jgi:predicted Ser/Thr protein kinase
MEQQGEWIYCVADETYFDTPDRIQDDATRYAPADRPAPEGWGRGEADLWVGLEPPVPNPPAQGWKIHVSVTPADAPRCIELVWDYCVAHRLAFKFLRSADAMTICNAKYAGRGSSGKLVTMYPRDEAELAAAVQGLSVLLAGMEGPYVLGDLRIGDGPLYVRYGGFAEMWCGDDGDEAVLAIRDGAGELVPDRRGPVFRVPPWVEMPDVLRPHLAARDADGIADFPYQVEKALHFSNSGGIYLARNAAGERVVLREARPHAGLDRNGADAVARLDREHTMLSRLAGLDCVPRVNERRVVQGHHFLAEEYIEGNTLLAAIQRRSPALYPDTPPEQLAREAAEYRDWATTVLDRVAAALDAVHARGVRFGDLHPDNVILRPNDDVVLIDFEFAADLDDTTPPGLGAPGFAAPQGLTGAAVDHYALRCLRVFAFSVLTPIIDFDRAKATTVAAAAREVAGMPAQYGVDFIRSQGPEPGRDEAAAAFDRPVWSDLRDSLVAGIHAGATPERQDRLFPGAPAQFATGGFDLAHGAAGVVLALHRVGATVPDEYVDWLTAAVRQTRVRPARGLYNGPHGVAAALDALGRHDVALEVLAQARGLDRLPASDALYGGHTGQALNLLHFAQVTGDEALRDAALRTGAGIADRLGGADTWLGGQGLLRGPSGPALLFLHLADETGDEHWLDRARSALRRDLDQGTALPDGSFQLAVGPRHVPYLDSGGAGVALVLREYLRRRDEPAFERALTGIRRSCTTPFVYQPGLYAGRAGLIATLAALGYDEDRPALLDQVRRLGWHALLREGHLVFPGPQLLRLSLDVGPRAAGVQHAL